MFKTNNKLPLIRKVWNNFQNGHRIRNTLLGTWLLVAIHIAVLSNGYITRPALSQACYRNTQRADVFPQNSCCKIYNYTKKDVHRCIERKIKFLRPKRKNNDDTSFSDEENISTSSERTNNNYERETSHIIRWTIVGDSRMRQIFSALVSLLSEPRLKYKKPSTLGRWRSVHELTEILRIGKLHENIKVRHLNLPIELNFYWDPLLSQLPKLLQKWEENKTERPSLLLLGSGLHWMRNSLHMFRTIGIKAAALKFKQHMENLLPKLRDMTAFAEIIIQLQEPIQESKVFPKYQGVYANKNIDLYNSITASTFSKSGTTLWDSNLPLTDYYYAQCQISNRKSIDKSWDCENPFHSGFIVVEEYVNMLLNSVCNKYLDLDDTYCSQ